MLVLSIVHSQIVSTTTISKKSFLKTPRSHSPRRAKRGHPTSTKIKSKFIILTICVKGIGYQYCIANNKYVS